MEGDINMIRFLYELDSSVLLWIQDTFENSYLTTVLKLITMAGNAGVIWIVLSAVFCVNKKTRRIGVLSFLGLAGSLIINIVILKNLVARTRPYETLSQVKLLIEAQNDYSFPSGHTASSFVVASVIFFSTRKKYGIPCMLFAGLMGFTRLYVGVHYPSDVLAGMMSGITIGYFTVKLGNRLDGENSLITRDGS